MIVGRESSLWRVTWNGVELAGRHTVDAGVLPGWRWVGCAPASLAGTTHTGNTRRHTYPNGGPAQLEEFIALYHTASYPCMPLAIHKDLSLE